MQSAYEDRMTNCVCVSEIFVGPMGPETSDAAFTQELSASVKLVLISSFLILNSALFSCLYKP